MMVLMWVISSSLDPRAIIRNLLNSATDDLLANPSAILAGIDFAHFLHCRTESYSAVGTFLRNSYSFFISSSENRYTSRSVTSLIIISFYPIIWSSDTRVFRSTEALSNLTILTHRLTDKLSFPSFLLIPTIWRTDTPSLLSLLSILSFPNVLDGLTELFGHLNMELGVRVSLSSVALSNVEGRRSSLQTCPECIEGWK